MSQGKAIVGTVLIALRARAIDIGHGKHFYFSCAFTGHGAVNCAAELGQRGWS